MPYSLDSSLSQQNRELRTQLETTTQENQQLRQEMLTKDGTLEAKEESLVARQRENQQLRQELHAKEEPLVTGQRQTHNHQKNDVLLQAK